MGFLVRTHDDAPKLYTIPMVVFAWEQSMDDYNDKVIDGVRRFLQSASIDYMKASIRRSALTAKKRDGVLEALRKYLRTLAMGGDGCYWIRSLPPRMEEAVGKGGFEHAMAKILGSIDTAVVHQKKDKMRGVFKKRTEIGVDERERERQRGRFFHVGNSWGASVGTADRMCPSGKRNSRLARSIAMSNTQSNRPGVPISGTFLAWGMWQTWKMIQPPREYDIYEYPLGRQMRIGQEGRFAPRGAYTA